MVFRNIFSLGDADEAMTNASERSSQEPLTTTSRNADGNVPRKPNEINLETPDNELNTEPESEVEIINVNRSNDEATLHDVTVKFEMGQEDRPQFVLETRRCLLA